MNEINDGIHVLQFHFRMGHEEAQGRAPEVGVFNALSERADGDFAGKLLTASESSRLMNRNALSASEKPSEANAKQAAD